jgi:outer membrane protein assembly factor BamD (BamD/ComL family)
MILRMMLKLTAPLLAVTGAVFLASSCGSTKNLPPMAGSAQASSSEGEVLYQEAKAADDAGKSSRAIKLYDQVASRHPAAPSAPQARFRQAELLEQAGDVPKAFDAYQKFIERFQGSGLYARALERQAAMAQSAAEGDVSSSFLGLRSKFSLDKTVGMLEKVRDNAPKSRTASKAQFTIGRLYEGKKKAKEAVAAYRQLVRDQPESPEAPEALFRVGEIFIAEADRGNRNQATLDLAREAFNDYLIQYPGHSRNGEARAKISALGGRELQRAFETAQFYEKTGQIESAKVYYRDIVRQTKSGKLHDAARARLRELGE